MPTAALDAEGVLNRCRHLRKDSAEGEPAPPVARSTTKLVRAERSERGRSHYRSTSPMIGSMEEMMATASATKRPCIMCGIVWRFTNDGARMCTRYGRAEPSDTR